MEGSIRSLSTENMNDVITKFKESVKTYTQIRKDVKSNTKAVLEDWKGKGKEAFEKDYKTVYRQLEDIEDILYELYNNLADSLSEYMMIDNKLAKDFTK